MAINICEPCHEKVVKALVTQLCPTLCNPIDYSPPGSSAYGFLQARILELVAIPFSRGSSQPRDQTQVSCIAAGFFTIWATRKAQALASTISLNPYQFSSVQLLSRVRLFATQWTTACQPSLSITISQSLLKLMSLELVLPYNHLILCRPLLLPPSIFPSIRVFSNESVLLIR